MKIAEYIILESDTVEMLVYLINEKLKENWIPLGGVAIEANPTYRPNYYQAMIRN